MSTLLLERPAEVEDANEVSAVNPGYASKIAQMIKALEASDSAFAKAKLVKWSVMGAEGACPCPACNGLAVGPRRVALPPAAQLAEALEQVAEFCLDPRTPKSPSKMATHGSIEVNPCDPQADHWCAIGFLGKLVGENDVTALCDTLTAAYGVPMSRMWQSFDQGLMDRSAMVARSLAQAVLSGA